MTRWVGVDKRGRLGDVRQEESGERRVTTEWLADMWWRAQRARQSLDHALKCELHVWCDKQTAEKIDRWLVTVLHWHELSYVEINKIADEIDAIGSDGGEFTDTWEAEQLPLWPGVAAEVGLGEGAGDCPDDSGER